MVIAVISELIYKFIFMCYNEKIMDKHRDHPSHRHHRKPADEVKPNFNTLPGISLDAVSEFEKTGEILGQRIIEILQEADRKATYIALHAFTQGSPSEYDDGPEPSSRVWVLTNQKIGGRADIESPCLLDGTHDDGDVYSNGYDDALTYIANRWMIGEKEARRVLKQGLDSETTTLCIEAHRTEDGTLGSYGLALRVDHALAGEFGLVSYLTDTMPSDLIFPEGSKSDRLEAAMNTLLDKLAERLSVDMGGYINNDPETLPAQDLEDLSRRPNVDISEDTSSKFLPPQPFYSAAEVAGLIKSTTPPPQPDVLATPPPTKKEVVVFDRHEQAVAHFKAQHPFAAILRWMTGKL